MGLIQQLLSHVTQLETRSSQYLAVIAISVCVWALYRLTLPKAKHNLPVFKLKDNNVLAVLTEAYKQVR